MHSVAKNFTLMDNGSNNSIKPKNECFSERDSGGIRPNIMLKSDQVSLMNGSVP